MSFQVHPRNVPFQEPWLETRVLFPVSSLHELSLWHVIENHSSTRRYMLTLVSCTLRENYASLPIQFLGPAENGRNAKGWRPLIFSGRKRSGSKSNGAGQTSGFLCKARVEMVTADPFGRKKSPEENAVIC